MGFSVLFVYPLFLLFRRIVRVLYFVVFVKNMSFYKGLNFLLRAQGREDLRRLFGSTVFAKIFSINMAKSKKVS